MYVCMCVREFVWMYYIVSQTNSSVSHLHRISEIENTFLFLQLETLMCTLHILLKGTGLLVFYDTTWFIAHVHADIVQLRA